MSRHGCYEPSDERLIPYHNFLVEAAETERRLPKAINLTLKTLWPETASERNIDYKPDRTVVTLCKATNKQVDAHSRALELVINSISDPTDRRIVWAVAQSAAFRERGPKFKKLAHKFKGMGGSYPKGWRGLKKRYEEALLSILYAQQYKRSSKFPKVDG